MSRWLTCWQCLNEALGHKYLISRDIGVTNTDAAPRLARGDVMRVAGGSRSRNNFLHLSRGLGVTGTTGVQSSGRYEASVITPLLVQYGCRAVPYPLLNSPQPSFDHS